jgi:DNA-binding beta-propeller fold protein YncE
MPVKSGEMLGRYRLISEIGSGSFGAVWLSEDTWLSKRVALKIPHNQTLDFGKLLAEPKLLAALEHPNIIKLFTVEKESGTMFMVMEFVDGHSLRDRLKAGPIPQADALDIISGILGALAYAHQKGIVHRDLKPGNILMTPQGQIKITDFGTARALGSGEETVAAGTLFYMPKEQLLGRVTPASDIYSVGVMLFEMLTGKLPFFDDTGSKVIQKILSNEPPPNPQSLNPEIPDPLSAIILRALERDLTRRWKRAEDMLAALDAFRAGQPIPDAPAAPLPAHPVYEKFSRKVPRLADTLGRTQDFAFKTALGTRGRQDGQFMLPTGVAIDGQGRVLVCDAVRNQVVVMDYTGKFQKVLGMEGSLLDQGLRFHNPSAVAVDRNGRMYACDTKNCRIMVFGMDGELILQFGRPLVVVGLHEEKGVIGLNYPRGLALDEEEGLIYVADSGNNRLKVFSMEGLPIQTFGGWGDRTGEFNSPIGLAVGAQGRLYVVDSQNYRIQVFERGFRLLETFGRRGGNGGEFSHPPTGIAITVNEELAVCDDTDKMQVMTATGAFLGFVTGPRSGTMVPKYYNAAFSESEEIFAADEYGCQIHHFTLKEKS